MEKTTCMKIILPMTLILFLFMSVNNSAFGCGGGGGGGGKGGAKGGRGDAPTTTIQKFTRAQLEDFFKGLPEDVRELIISKQEGKDRTLAQLNLIRGIFFEAEKFRHESDAAIWQSYEDLAVLLDKTGQNAELVLTFVTGGTSTIVTRTLFGTVRKGVDEYSKGKSVGDIIQAMAVAVAVDNIMKAKGLKRLGDRGGQLVDMVYRANKLNKNPRVLKYLAKVGVKALGFRQSEQFTKAQIGKILNYIANAAKKKQVVNTTPVYSRQMGCGCF
jgi:hypothetical protein